MRARLGYGLRLLPLRLLATLWISWGAGLLLYCTAPAWSGRVPDALDTYRLLENWPGVLTGVSAALAADCEARADGRALLHALPAAGARLWAERLCFAIAACFLADLTALVAVRAYLPMPWGPTLGTLVAPSALFAALGFAAGSLWGSWAGAVAGLGLWIVAAGGWLAHPRWARLDPFLALQGPANALLLANRWALGATAAGLAALSVLGPAHADRWGAWLRCVCLRLPGGLRASAAGVVTAAALSACGVWWGLRPALEHPPARALSDGGAVRVAGAATVAVDDSGGHWSGTVAVPVQAEPLTTRLDLGSSPGTTVQRAWLGTARLLPVGPGQFAGRAPAWLQGRAATLRLQVALLAPADLAGLRLDGVPLGIVHLRWPPGAPLRPQGAAPCGAELCWTGPTAELRPGAEG